MTTAGKKIVARWHSVYYSWVEMSNIDVVAYEDDSYGYVVTGTAECSGGVNSWTVDELKQSPYSDAGAACSGKLGNPDWIETGWYWTPHPFESKETPQEEKQYPKNNDGLQNCAWCNAPTKKVDSILSKFDICTKCKK